MTIKAVVFDLGNVLLQLDHGVALRRLGAASGSRLLEAMRESTLLARLESGELEAPAFFEDMVRHTGLEVSYQEFCTAFCDIFSPVEAMIEANETLRSAGLPTYLFSNTNELHWRHIRQCYEFVSHFTAYFLSYEIRCMKPHRPIYEAVEQGIGLAPAELLYVDDRVENVEAGSKRGWQVIHHRSPAETISTMRALRVL
jgi:FMN phosphatase YigB (HAD superfamily)